MARFFQQSPLGSTPNLGTSTPPIRERRFMRRTQPPITSLSQPSDFEQTSTTGRGRRWGSSSPVISPAESLDNGSTGTSSLESADVQKQEQALDRLLGQQQVGFLTVPRENIHHLMAMERPPNEPDATQKISLRARSQSWLIRTRHLIHHERQPTPFISKALYALSVLMLILTFPFCLVLCFKVAKEYERAVVFRLGRLIASGTKGPGIFFVMPCIDTFRMVDLRVVSFDVPPQEILSKDSVTVSVDAVVYFRVSNPVISVTNVNDAQFSTKLLAQTTLRNVLGTKTLSEILSERDNIASVTEKVLDEGTDPWGVKVERVEVKDIRLPHMLMRAMATEAEASRDARAAIIAADGEKKASPGLLEAAELISQTPSAIQLRYLQTMVHISAEHNQTIVFPFPVEFVRWLRRRNKMKKKLK